VTASTAFDFEGNGRASVVYSDECFLWVFDGATGAVRFAAPHTSFTGTESPVVADVDGDGRAEIIMVSNGVDPGPLGWNCLGSIVNGVPWQPSVFPAQPYRGITVFGSADGSWAKARAMWNEATFHVSNISDGTGNIYPGLPYGAIPTNEVPNWTVPWLNNFRQNKLPPPNTPPVAKCKNVTVSAGANCTAMASIDNGSYDPDSGDTITLAQTPPGPYSLGDTVVTLTVTDNHGASSTSTSTVTVKDTTKPVITINGSATMTVECHTSFNDPGATGNDSCAGSVAVVASGSVDVNTPGSYTITYSAVDPSGNTQTATRTIKVVDTTKPVITVTGPNPLVVVLNGVFADPGATATDTCAGRVAVTASGSVDMTKVGTYTVTYSATDPSGNTQTATRAVNVQYVSGGICMGDMTHGILQPINSDGSSVFKKGSTVPAKFRVCDANGAAVGMAGVVTAFGTLAAAAEPANATINEDVVSTTPDTTFRWDNTGQQWIFNIGTKTLTSGTKYYYRIMLNDGTYIDFQFGVK
jgi:hypothetical protein